jgi:crossover junction endodeoxyribonuclease RuvC
VIILGIDPGLSGGIAVLDSYYRATIDAIDIPTHGEGAKRRVDAAAVMRFIRIWEPDIAFIERAGSMPGQGVASSFNYGRAAGALEAAVACAGIPITMVEASVWKRALGLPGGKANKEMARQRAIQLFPSASCFVRMKDHGRAEAALIAYYGLSKQQSPTSEATHEQMGKSS